VGKFFCSRWFELHKKPVQFKVVTGHSKTEAILLYLLDTVNILFLSSLSLTISLSTQGTHTKDNNRLICIPLCNRKKTYMDISATSV
jgi:hypothetical protein